MNLTDFFRLIRHYILLFLLITISCLIIGIVAGLNKTTLSNVGIIENNYVDVDVHPYMAKSTILVSSQVEGIGGIAKAESEVWSQDHNDRYAEWLVAENGRMQNQLNTSNNSTLKKSFENAPGSWLNTDYFEEFADLTIVESQTLIDENTVYIVAIGPDSSLCIEAANSVAEKTADISNKLYSVYPSYSTNKSDDSLSDSPIILDERIVNVEVIKSTFTTSAYKLIDDNVYLGSSRSSNQIKNDDGFISQIKSIVKYGLFGMIVGILVSVLLILLIEVLKRPIWNPDKIKDILAVPILINRTTDSDLMIGIENIELAASQNDNNILLAAVGDAKSSEDLYNALMKYSDNKEHFKNVGSIKTSNNAVRDIANSEQVILCIREWKDTIPDLENAINELKIAQSKSIGIAIV